MLEAGVKTPADVAAANANYQDAIYNRINAETELYKAEAEFEALTSLRAGIIAELPDITVSIPNDLDKLVVQAVANNHQIKHYRLQERARDKEVDATRGQLSPSCDLILDAGKTLKKQKYNNSQNEYSASLEVTVPIFENSANKGGNTYSSIAIADQKALQAKFTAEDALLQTKKECVVNWNKRISADALIKSSRSAVKSGEISSASNLEEAAIGTKSNTEILDDENKLLTARVNYAKARKEKIVSAAKILDLCGKLDLRSLLTKGGATG
jgi:outer membrane protein TolC